MEGTLLADRRALAEIAGVLGRRASPPLDGDSGSRKDDKVVRRAAKGDIGCAGQAVSQEWLLRAAPAKGLDLVNVNCIAGRAGKTPE